MRARHERGGDGGDEGGGVLDAPVRGSRAREGNVSPHGPAIRGSAFARTPPKAAPEKPPAPCARMPVPHTDTGGLAEHAEASGATAVKELGKKAP